MKSFYKTMEIDILCQTTIEGTCISHLKCLFLMTPFSYDVELIKYCHHVTLFIKEEKLVLLSNHVAQGR